MIRLIASGQPYIITRQRLSVWRNSIKPSMIKPDLMIATIYTAATWLANVIALPPKYTVIAVATTNASQQKINTLVFDMLWSYPSKYTSGKIITQAKSIMCQYITPDSMPLRFWASKPKRIQRHAKNAKTNKPSHTCKK